jgi:hypothetical protein
MSRGRERMTKGLESVALYQNDRKPHAPQARNEWWLRRDRPELMGGELVGKNWR